MDHSHIPDSITSEFDKDQLVYLTDLPSVPTTGAGVIGYVFNCQVNNEPTTISDIKKIAPNKNTTFEEGDWKNAKKLLKKEGRDLAFERISIEGLKRNRYIIISKREKKRLLSEETVKTENTKDLHNDIKYFIKIKTYKKLGVIHLAFNSTKDIVAGFLSSIFFALLFAISIRYEYIFLSISGLLYGMAHVYKNSAIIEWKFIPRHYPLSLLSSSHDEWTCLEKKQFSDGSRDMRWTLSREEVSARCPTCSASVRLFSSADLSKMPVGRCEAFPREHVFTFDRRSSSGKKLSI